MELNRKFVRNILLFVAISFFVLSVSWMVLPYNRASILWKKGYQEKAISIWKNQISKKNDAESYQRLIEVLINSGRYEEAEKFNQIALSNYPDCANFLFYEAMVNFYKGNFEKSFHYTEKVISCNEYFPEVYLLRGLILEKTSNYQEAKKEFIKEINNNPGNRLAWAKLQESKYANY
jgi:tetratricopeptide (TPR) repeat protein